MANRHESINPRKSKRSSLRRARSRKLEWDKAMREKANQYTMLLQVETNYGVRFNLHCLLGLCNKHLGIETPPLSTFGLKEPV
ncbi:hypothetical protein [Paludibacterium paludis]|nr:hypothetical protein [Paludibacterium paludis]